MIYFNAGVVAEIVGVTKYIQGWAAGNYGIVQVSSKKSEVAVVQAKITAGKVSKPARFVEYHETTLVYEV